MNVPASHSVPQTLQFGQKRFGFPKVLPFVGIALASMVLPGQDIVIFRNTQVLPASQAATTKKNEFIVPPEQLKTLQNTCNNFHKGHEQVIGYSKLGEISYRLDKKKKTLTFTKVDAQYRELFEVTIQFATGKVKVKGQHADSVSGAYIAQVIDAFNQENSSQKPNLQDLEFGDRDLRPAL